MALDSTFTLAWASLSASPERPLFQWHALTPSWPPAPRSRRNGPSTLDPKGADGHSALARYYLNVAKSPIQAGEQMTLALQATPNDPGAAEHARPASSGRSAGGSQALQHLQLARRLDPRSARVAGELHRTLVSLRRYPEAIAAGNDALALAPATLNVIETQMMAYLGQGDLRRRAHGACQRCPATIAQPAVVAYLATYNDLYWVLDDAEQQLLLRLPASAFFDDPAAWGSVKMQTWWMRGDKAKARAYADSARVGPRSPAQGGARRPAAPRRSTGWPWRTWARRRRPSPRGRRAWP